MNNRQKLSTDQRGIMAIVVTVLIMTVLSITTLAMAKMARREQRQSLDATMSVQANYAVESGINDSVAYLNSGGTPISACTGPAGAVSVNTTLGNTMTIPAFVSLNGYNLDLGGYNATTSYTCALISKTAKTLNYTVDGNSSSVANITASASSLTISWQSKDGVDNFRPDPCAQSLPTSWVNPSGSPFTPMLRVDITNLTGGFSRNSMASSTGTIYLNPCVTGTATPTFASGYTVGTTNPQIINGSCNAMNTPRKCTATISFAGAYSKLLVRLHSVYGGAANVSISANNQDISGAQVTIDVTAKSNDVVKRVRKTFPILAGQPYLYAIESQNAICKRLNISAADATGYDVSIVPPADIPVCNPF